MNNERNPNPATDPLLQLLVKIANSRVDSADGVAPLSLILFVGGIAVSGRLVSRAEFLEKFEDGAVGEALENLTLADKDVTLKQVLDGVTGSADDSAHMLGCKLLMSNANMFPLPGAGAFRVRLDAVTAWIPGELVC